ncbi:hypothetical protein DSECCO2_302020 [anaerobic digester metagenome]
MEAHPELHTDQLNLSSITLVSIIAALFISIILKMTIFSSCKKYCYDSATLKGKESREEVFYIIAV